MNDVARRFAAEAMMGAHEAPAPFNDRFARTLGSDLTPQLVAAALANAEIGYMWNQADLLDEVRERDGHLHSELQKREMRVAGAPWELKPPEGAGRSGRAYRVVAHRSAERHRRQPRPREVFR